MKKFWLMFAFVLCGALAFTSCDKDENEIKPGTENNQEQPEGDWKIGFDESKAPNELTLRYEAAGAKITIVAKFKDGKCYECKATSRYPGIADQVIDYSDQFNEFTYEQIYEAFKQLAGMK